MPLAGHRMLAFGTGRAKPGAPLLWEEGQGVTEDDNNWDVSNDAAVIPVDDWMPLPYDKQFKPKFGAYTGFVSVPLLRHTSPPSVYTFLRQLGCTHAHTFHAVRYAVRAEAVVALTSKRQMRCAVFSE